MIEKLESEKTLKLPFKEFGPFCLKILQEFIEHHKLPKDLQLPEKAEKLHIGMSKIFDVMLHSMGPEKRNEILIDLDKYKMSLPAHFRD
jgi:hypothetical protein